MTTLIIDTFQCTVCNANMNSGYSTGGNMSVEECDYYCSDACLHRHYTQPQWSRIVALGEGDLLGDKV
jgi:hypothetical protein